MELENKPSNLMQIPILIQEENIMNLKDPKLTEDHAIWTAKIENDLVVEWCIYEDTEENRKKFSL